jgi:hypothetical protein
MNNNLIVKLLDQDPIKRLFDIFEDEAKELAAFQNKHKQWIHSGGVVKFLTEGKI